MNHFNKKTLYILQLILLTNSFYLYSADENNKKRTRIDIQKDGPCIFESMVDENGMTLYNFYQNECCSRLTNFGQLDRQPIEFKKIKLEEADEIMGEKFGILSPHHQGKYFSGYINNDEILNARIKDNSLQIIILDPNEEITSSSTVPISQKFKNAKIIQIEPINRNLFMIVFLTNSLKCYGLFCKRDNLYNNYNLLLTKYFPVQNIGRFLKSYLSASSFYFLDAKLEFSRFNTINLETKPLIKFSKLQKKMENSILPLFDLDCKNKTIKLVIKNKNNDEATLYNFSWNSFHHDSYPVEIQNNIFTSILCFNRCKNIPQELKTKIFNDVIWDNFIFSTLH